MRRLALLSLLIGVMGCRDAAGPVANGAPGRLTPSVNTVIPGSYIVAFRSDERDPIELARALTAANGGTIIHVYRTALRGFAVTGLSDFAANAIRSNPRVALVEPNGVVTTAGIQSPVPSWGLDRIDAVSGLSGSYSYPNEGTGVTAYIIDTGINSTSSDFTGRLTLGPAYDGATTSEDCNGHGTHVAGTLGGTVYGVAKKVSLVAIRVLNCLGNGSYDAVIAGLDWVAQNHAALSVANLSLSGSYSAALNQAIAATVATGVAVVAAAGNTSGDACGYSPGSEPSAMTVGAIAQLDQWASYSNFGSCIDINAPGTGITSDWIGGADVTNTLNGTSMAAPHVAGAAAMYLSVNPSATPAQVATSLIGAATVGAISAMPSGTANRLLYVGFIASGTMPPDASFSPAACGGGFTCSFTANAAGLTYSWSFSDGGGGNTRTVIHTFPKKGGSYTVTLLASSGSLSASSAQTVSCNPKKGCK
jgi:subtilisin family serine protease